MEPTTYGLNLAQQIHELCQQIRPENPRLKQDLQILLDRLDRFIEHVRLSEKGSLREEL